MDTTVASTLLRSWNSWPAKEANWRPFNSVSSVRLSGRPHLKQSLKGAQGGVVGWWGGPPDGGYRGSFQEPGGIGDGLLLFQQVREKA